MSVANLSCMPDFQINIGGVNAKNLVITETVELPDVNPFANMPGTAQQVLALADDDGNLEWLTIGGAGGIAGIRTDDTGSLEITNNANIVTINLASTLGTS